MSRSAADPVVLRPLDHAGGGHIITFVSPTLERGIVIAASGLLAFAVILLAAGLWAKRRVVNL